MRYLGVFAALVFVLGTVCEVAANAENVFAGKVVVLKKLPPTYFPTKDGFVSFLRNNSVKTLYADENNEWMFQSMAFFKKPLGDYEVEMVFYDVKNGKSKDKRKFVNSFTQYTQDRNTRSLLGRAILIRPSFDANRDYMVVVQRHSEEVATGFFSTKGVSQAQLDEQKRQDAEMKKMEESMKELERKAKEQEEQQKRDEEQKNRKAADSLF
jgi:predicted ribosome quality control (RQC) complex YloA/Tae2 family protein